MHRCKAGSNIKFLIQVDYQVNLAMSSSCFFRGTTSYFKAEKRLIINTKYTQPAFSLLHSSFRFQFHIERKNLLFILPLQCEKGEDFYPPADMTFFRSVIVSASFEHCNCRSFRECQYKALE